MFLVPSSTITGAHVIRSPRGLTVTTSLRLGSRLRALTMLTQRERKVLADLLGDSFQEWATADLFTASEVPLGLRAGNMRYDTYDAEALAS